VGLRSLTGPGTYAPRRSRRMSRRVMNGMDTEKRGNKTEAKAMWQDGHGDQGWWCCCESVG
jgi:hypothetical protein